MQKYGEQVLFAAGDKLQFPDFSIRFAGIREIESGKSTVPNVKLSLLEFEVIKGDEKQTISWAKNISRSNDTAGNRAGELFAVNGEKYFLEIERSDILKTLNDNCLVIWTAADYENELMKNYK